MINWLINRICSSSVFQEIIEEKVKSYYKYNSLVDYRVWGDESRVSLGSKVQVNNALFNTVSGKIIVGDGSFFGHNVSLYTGTHDYTKLASDRQAAVPLSGRDIVIGKDVWVASDVIVLAPCSIGDNSVIGAGSIVTGDIPSNSIYRCVCSKETKEISLGK